MAPRKLRKTTPVSQAKTTADPDPDYTEEGTDTMEFDTEIPEAMIKKEDAKATLDPTETKNDDTKPASRDAAGESADSPAAELKASSKSIIKKKGLAKFNLAGKAKTNDGWLRCCVLQAPNNMVFVVFRCEPKDPLSTRFHAEKRFNDSVYQRAEWIKDFNISSIVRKWHHNNKEMKNSKNYAVRLFIMRLPTPMNKNELQPPMLIELGKDICEEINKTPSYFDSKISVDPNNYFWGDNALFCDIYGDEDAYKELIYHCPPTGDGDYYDNNRDVIALFFREGCFPPARAKHLNLREDHYNKHPSFKASGNQTTVTVVVS